MVTIHACALLAVTFAQNAPVSSAPSADTQDTVLLQFTASWCRPCQQMKPALEQLQSRGYPIQQVDFERRSDLVRRYQVSSVPTFVLVSGGQEVGRMVGAASAQELAGMFARVRRAPTASAGQQVAADGGVPRIDFSWEDPPAPSQRSAGASFSQPQQPAMAAASPRASAGGQAAVGANWSPGSVPFQTPLPASTSAAAPPRSAPQFSGQQGPPVQSRPFTPVSHQTAGNSAGRTSAEQRAQHATVRIKVTDDRGFGFATGTIIDQRGAEVLVLTCGHVFKDSNGKGAITIDTFYPGGPKQLPGHVVAWEVRDRDVALVSFRPPSPPPAIELARGKTYSKGDLVFTLGCSRGADPTLEMTRITSIDRYHGASNIEIAGQPVDGRSGGGLFNEQGQLIGVCNAADPTDDEGIYAALPAIEEHLAANGMTHLLGDGSRVASAAPATPAPGRFVPASPNPELSTLPSAQVEAAAMSAGSAPVTPVSVRGAAPASPGVEVIVVVRPAGGAGAGRVLNIRQPSQQLLERLESESAGAPTVSPTAAPQSNAQGPIYSAGNLRPIVRGQNRR